MPVDSVRVPIDCRRLGPDDAAMFQALRLRGLEKCPTAFASSYAEEAPLPLTTVADRLRARPDRAVLGAFCDGALVGMCGIVREPQAKLAHKGLIWGVYVAPPTRTCGVGTAVIRAALDVATRELGVRQVNIGVNALNAPAIALYEKLGFERFGFERRFMIVDGEPQDEFQMVCVLDRGPWRGHLSR